MPVENVWRCANGHVFVMWTQHNFCPVEEWIQLGDQVCGARCRGLNEVEQATFKLAGGWAVKDMPYE